MRTFILLLILPTLAFAQQRDFSSCEHALTIVPTGNYTVSFLGKKGLIPSEGVFQHAKNPGKNQLWMDFTTSQKGSLTISFLHHNQPIQLLILKEKEEDLKSIKKVSNGIKNQFISNIEEGKQLGISLNNSEKLEKDSNDIKEKLSTIDEDGKKLIRKMLEILRYGKPLNRENHLGQHLGGQEDLVGIWNVQLWHMLILAMNLIFMVVDLI